MKNMKEKTIYDRLMNKDKCFSRAENIKNQVLNEGRDLYSLIASYIFKEHYDNCVQYDLKGNIFYPGKVRRTIAKKIALNRASIEELKDFYIKENIENESIVQDLHDKVYEAFPYTFDEDMEEEFIEYKHLDATTFIINMTGYIRHCLHRNYYEEFKKKFLNSISYEFFKDKPENVSKFMFLKTILYDVYQIDKKCGSYEFEKLFEILKQLKSENIDQTLEYLDYIIKTIEESQLKVFKIPIFLGMLPTNFTIFEGSELYQYNENDIPSFVGDKDYVLKIINNIKETIFNNSEFLAFDAETTFGDYSASISNLEKTIELLNPSSNIPEDFIMNQMIQKHKKDPELDHTETNN